MDLREWLFWNNMTKAEFARLVGISRSYAHELLSGKSKCLTKIALKIYEITRGEVTIRTLLKKTKWKEFYRETNGSIRRDAGKKDIPHGKVDRKTTKRSVVVKDDIRVAAECTEKRYS